MQPLALVDAEEGDVEQSWPGLFWLPPVDDEPGERDMLHLDDELAGLVEAADMSADQHVAHSAKPEAASSVPGDSFVVHGNLAATVLAMCWVGLGWAGLGWAELGWAGLGWAGLGWAVLSRVVLGHEYVLHLSLMRLALLCPAADDMSVQCCHTFTHGL